MCTIGVRRFGDNDYVVFKNKDFPRPWFEDRIVTEPGVFGVRGVATWSQSDAAEDEFSGLSTGANAAGLLCADANVHGAANQSNYDELVEIALRAGGGVADGIAAIEAACAARPYLWGNIIMIDAVAAAAVEVRDKSVAVTPVKGPAARSNHHLLLNRPGDAAGSPTTEQRLAAAQRRVREAEALDGILRLQRAHDDGETGICNHEVSQTVYSYALRRQGDSTRLYVTQGHPCQAGESVELLVPFGAQWSAMAASGLRAAYPSTQATIES